MSIFGDEGQVDVQSLSDEVLYGIEERQDEEHLPQAEPDDTDKEDMSGKVQEDVSGEVQEDDSGEEPKETTKNEQKGDAPEGQAEPMLDELSMLRQQYDNLRKWTTQTAMKNGELQRQIEEMQKAKTDHEKSPEEAEEDKKAYLKSLLEDPNGIINKAVAERVAEALRPIIAERERIDVNRKIGEAIEDVATGWVQVKNDEGKREVLKRMLELSAQSGDAEAWQKDPSRLAIAACRSLWGWPSHVDKDAVAAAQQAAVKTIREQQSANKEGLVVNQSVNKQQSKELTPEEKIVAEMRGTLGGGLFD